MVVGSGDKRQSKVIVASLKDCRALKHQQMLGPTVLLIVLFCRVSGCCAGTEAPPPGGVTAALPGNNDRAAWIQHFFSSLIMMRRWIKIFRYIQK